MKLFLTKQCESLTGSLGTGYGYHIQHRKNGFFAKRNAKGIVPPDGHWRFIVACAKLANAKLHVTDIELHWTEAMYALEEARHFVAAQMVHDNFYGKCKITYNADDILNLKTTFGL